jgi:hypothetical protein
MAEQCVLSVRLRLKQGRGMLAAVCLAKEVHHARRLVSLRGSYLIPRRDTLAPVLVSASLWFQV